jgi:hypothetical protein
MATHPTATIAMGGEVIESRAELYILCRYKITNGIYKVVRKLLRRPWLGYKKGALYTTTYFSSADDGLTSQKKKSFVHQDSTIVYNFS